MVFNGVILAWSGFSGGSIGNMLSRWEQWGIFSYVLPFLVIFALVFSILSMSKIFQGSKGVNAVISLAVGFMSLQFEFVPQFFSQIFPRVGVGLAVLLAFIIFFGFFITDTSDKKIMGILMAIGIIIVLVILYNTAGSLGWSMGYMWQENLDGIIWVILGVGAILFIIFATNNPKEAKYAKVG